MKSEWKVTDITLKNLRVFEIYRLLDAQKEETESNMEWFGDTYAVFLNELTASKIAEKLNADEKAGRGW